MTPKELADGVKLRLGATNQDFGVGERTIMWMGDLVRGKLISQYIRINGDTARGEFAKSVIMDVELDGDRNLKYVKSDYNFLSLPNLAGIMGIGYIRNTSGRSDSEADQFIQTDVGQATVYKGLEASNCGVEYWQETDRIYFSGLGNEVKQVLVKCIPSIAKLDPRIDQISIPYISLDDMVEMVAQKIMNRIPEDKSDDTRQTPE